MSVTFVGDVHGWPGRLEQIVAQAEGELLLLGDLIDRGPDSAAVVRLARELCEAGRARCIMGNHEYAMVRGLGVPDLGIEAVPGLFLAWQALYGGMNTLHSYGVSPYDTDGLRRALGDDLTWLAQLPWLAEGREGERSWIAVHAGLDAGALAPQLDALRDPSAWWRADAELPFLLYSKELVDLIPQDLPPGCCVVSGHTPLEEVYVTPERIVCDTSGGMSGEALSAVIWPEGRVLQAL